MIYIVLDLEATCWKNDMMRRKQEVIELGAFKINPFGEVLDTFHSYVRPVLHPKLSYYCKELTGIVQVRIDRAPTFEDIYEDFIDWGELYDDDVVLVAWGEGDRRILSENCRIFGLEIEALIPSYFDVKSAYRKLHKLPTKVGLQKAIRLEGLEFEGEAHRAMDDAKNLLHIFVRHLDEWQI